MKMDLSTESILFKGKWNTSRQSAREEKQDEKANPEKTTLIKDVVV